MNLVQLKTAKELVLKGLNVEFVTQGDTLVNVRLSDATNTYVILNPNSYSSNLSVFREEAFKTEKKFVVEGKLDGFEVSKVFDAKFDAEQFVRDMDTEKAKLLTISEKQVKIDVTLKASQSDEIPF